ncbi:MAG: sigma-70 family RNA polymerase sigma factor [Myxococcales bacterium]|nr:sigma-70 family RNA polymerase sigma factor [Myxococcales bacterium]MCB9749743.1 sigma-70 family RNA polymerase sigma factor [Myxococcales bacterium]
MSERANETWRDRELLRSWRAGDARAADILFRRYEPRLWKFLHTKIPEHDIPDVIQLIWEGVVRARDRLEPEPTPERDDARDDADDDEDEDDDEERRAAVRVSFRAYLYGIARRRLYRYYRGRTRRGGAAFDPQISRLIDVAPSVSKVVAKRARERRLVEATQRLPLDLQVLLEMHYVADLSCTEMARVCELPVGTVKSRLRRAKRQLEELLESAPSAPL